LEDKFLSFCLVKQTSAELKAITRVTRNPLKTYLLSRD